jgi:hypothetical protein
LTDSRNQLPRGKRSSSTPTDAAQDGWRWNDPTPLSLCACSSKLKTHRTSEIGTNLQHKEEEEEEEDHISKNFMFDMRAPYNVVSDKLGRRKFFAAQKSKCPPLLFLSFFLNSSS